MRPRGYVVFDVGKTLAKLSLWDECGGLIARESRANVSSSGMLDVAGITSWLEGILCDFASRANVEAIIPVGHGAAAVLVRDGQLIAAQDYEAEISADALAEYALKRDPFALTGSPALPNGLNLGAQLYAFQWNNRDAFAEGAQILLWPQYWAWVLSGVAASEVTSLGCHTDLWRPNEAHPSDLAVSQGWAACLPALRRANEVLGTITEDWAGRTGLPTTTRIHCGLHDSNAALLAAHAFSEIGGGENGPSEATVLSTGTWFVALRTIGRAPAPDRSINLADLPEARDCLVNVDAYGKALPSARWMGGREIETLVGLDTRRVDIKPDQPALLAAVPEVLACGAMLLPSFAPGFGPFPKHDGVWINRPDDWNAQRAAVCLYAALVTHESLNLIGARERILIEGRFAEADVFVRALAWLRPDDAIYIANAHNDVSFGALRLILPDLLPAGALRRVAPLDADLTAYTKQWHAAVVADKVAA